MSGTKGTKKDHKPGADGTDQDQNQDQEKDSSQNQGTGDQSNENDEQGGGDDDLFKDPVKSKKAIEDLRKENAKHRTKNKELASKVSTMEGTLGKLQKAFGGKDDEDADPAEKAAALSQQNERLQLEIHMRDLARDSGVAPEKEKYFRFLLEEKLGTLEEGEEISDEEIQAVAKEAMQGVAPKKSSSGIESNKKPDPDEKSDITVEQFAKMNTGEKSELYVKNQQLYNKLFAEAREKRMI